jgi:hypothetical protein
MTSRDRIFEEEKNYIPHDLSRKGLNPELMEELHNKIATGEIDVGHKPDHTEPVKDIRPALDGETAWLLYKTANPDTEFFRPPELRGFVDNRNGTRPLP